MNNQPTLTTRSGKITAVLVIEDGLKKAKVVRHDRSK